jgi:hypothetical protein
MKAFATGLRTGFGASVVLLSTFLTAASAEPTFATTHSLQRAPTSSTAASDITKSPTPEAEWRMNMAHKKVQKGGCYQATFPETELKEVPCAAPPQTPFSPAGGASPRLAGTANNFSAQPRGLISSATGFFDSVSGVSSEKNSDGVVNSYSLQLNTNNFTTPFCARGTSDCKGWEQFVYSDNGKRGLLFIQYWLVRYGASTCPAGWQRSEDSCYRNSARALTMPHQSITNLRALKITGTANAAGQDTIVMVAGNTAYSVSDPGSTLSLSNGWTVAEFNIFGNGNASQAQLNPGATLVVRTEVENGTTEAPACVRTGLTGESSNLSINGLCSTLGGTHPAIVFTESVGPAVTDIGPIWSFNGTPCNGAFCPGWAKLDDSRDTVRVAAGATSVYQLQKSGRILKYTGTPCGEACPPWVMLDNNPATVQIAAAGSELYQLRSDGTVWRHTGASCSSNSCTGWVMLDKNSTNLTISAATGGLYVLRNTGVIQKYTGVPCAVAGTFAICPGWQKLDGNPATVAIAAASNNLYQLHDTGRIYRYTGTPCSGASCPGWQQLGNVDGTIAIAAGGNNLYQLHPAGVFRYTGTPCNSAGCPGWQMLDNNPRTLSISTGGEKLYQLRNDGSVGKFTGVGCVRNFCIGWEKEDDNPATGRLVASDTQLFQILENRIPPTRTRTCYECR